MKLLFASLLVFALALTCQAQTTTSSTPVALPTAVSVVGEFNQLGTPQWAIGLSALYTTNAQSGIGMYNTSTADVVPIKATDPATGKQFWAVSAQFRQGVHEKLLSTGKFVFLLGGDIGPGFSTSTSGIAVSATGSFVATCLYRVNSWMNVVVPIRMLYVSNVGWNPVVQAGVSFNLSKLPPATK
jgi:hypothetical protein